LPNKEVLTTALKMTVEPMAEILTQPERRRRWTSEQKLALVSESLRPGASPTQVARRYGISTGLLYTWRQLARSGELALVSAPAPAFVPVEIVPEALGLCGGERGDGVMVIELPGDRRVRVDRHVDTDALRRVLLALGATA
jgi:transposase